MTVEEALKFIVSCGMVSPSEINSKFLGSEQKMKRIFLSGLAVLLPVALTFSSSFSFSIS